jgi:hypothetical protein
VVAILFLTFFFWVALFHSFVDRPDDFDIGRADRELARLNAGGTGFDFVNPVEEPTDRRLIAAAAFVASCIVVACNFEIVRVLPPTVAVTWSRAASMR